jgi:SagB-type dehydrogenase family enzyme
MSHHDRLWSRLAAACVILVLATAVSLPAQTDAGTIPDTLPVVQLPPPRTTGGKPLMQALKDRHSTREFGSQKLSPQVLSNLLWAAFGVNRPDGRRTAPSAMNWQEVDIYVATPDGLYLYDAKANALHTISTRDVREATGTQDFVKEAAANLVYVADLAKTGRASGEEQTLYLGADAGFIAQNVYLFCASEGLAAVVRGSVERPALSKLMKLRPEQKIILAQTVGYPKQ